MNPALSSSSDPPENGSPVVNAYSLQNSSTRRIAIIIIISFSFILLRNIFFRDYTLETKQYLTSIGREDAIEKIVPPTYSDVVQQKKLEKDQLKLLVMNVTNLALEVSTLKSEMARVKSATSDIANAIEQIGEKKELGLIAQQSNNKKVTQSSEQRLRRRRI